MPSTLRGTRSNTIHFCKCGEHSLYHCKLMGDEYNYCKNKKVVKKKLILNLKKQNNRDSGKKREH